MEQASKKRHGTEPSETPLKLGDNDSDSPLVQELSTGLRFSEPSSQAQSEPDSFEAASEVLLTLGENFDQDPAKTFSDEDFAPLFFEHTLGKVRLIITTHRWQCFDISSKTTFFEDDSNFPILDFIMFKNTCRQFACQAQELFD